MRVLLRNSDGLHCIEVISACVNPEENELILENTEQYVTVSGIAGINAEAAVRALFRDGMADLSMYPSDI